jgi:hypothetical protein
MPGPISNFLSTSVAGTELSAEQRLLRAVRQAHNRLLRRVRQLKTNLEKYKAEIELVSQQIGLEVRKKIEQIQSLRLSAGQLFDRLIELIKNTNGHGALRLAQMKKDLEDSLEGIPEIRNATTAKNANTDTHFLDQFVQALTPDENRAIRNIYIDLARKFHPDQSLNVQEQQQRTLIMQQITAAYKQGDLAQLVEFEKVEKADDKLALESTETIRQEIEKWQQRITLLERQAERLKAERKLIEKSAAGKMLAAFREMQYGKRSRSDEMLTFLEQTFQNLSELCEGLAEMAATGEVPDDFLFAPDEQLSLTSVVK